jgi:rubredoxin
MQPCRGPDKCGAGYGFNGLDEDSPERQESNKAAMDLGWRRTNSGWICPTCAGKL